MTEMAASAPTRQPQSKALRAWLIFVILASLWSAYRYYSVIADMLDHRDPRWQGLIAVGIPALLVLSLVNVVGAVVLFTGRKIGFAIIVTVNIAALVIAILLGVPIAALVPGLVGLSVLSYLYDRNQWRFN
jgi:hypothetical protein